QIVECRERFPEFHREVLMETSNLDSLHKMSGYESLNLSISADRRNLSDDN
ncbi:hypothetical protein STEG23_018314, partial [Scotinomys teguina]